MVYILINYIILLSALGAGFQSLKILRDAFVSMLVQGNISLQVAGQYLQAISVPMFVTIIASGLFYTNIILD